MVEHNEQQEHYADFLKKKEKKELEEKQLMEKLQANLDEVKQLLQKDQQTEKLLSYLNDHILELTEEEMQIYETVLESHPKLLELFRTIEHVRTTPPSTSVLQNLRQLLLSVQAEQTKLHIASYVETDILPDTVTFFQQRFPLLGNLVSYLYIQSMR